MNTLKLIDKGVGEEAFAFLVLFQFPVELGSVILAGRCARTNAVSVASVGSSVSVTLNL